MDDQTKARAWAWFAELNQGQIYAFVGIAICLGSFLGENQFASFTQDRINYAYGFGVCLWISGTALHVWRVRIEASRPIVVDPEIVLSNHDREFLDLFDRQMTEAEVFALDFRPDRAKDERRIRGTMNIFRANKLAWAKELTLDGGIYRRPEQTYLSPVGPA